MWHKILNVSGSYGPNHAPLTTYYTMYTVQHSIIFMQSHSSVQKRAAQQSALVILLWLIFVGTFAVTCVVTCSIDAVVIAACFFSVGILQCCWHTCTYGHMANENDYATRYAKNICEKIPIHIKYTDNWIEYILYTLLSSFAYVRFTYICISMKVCIE